MGIVLFRQIVISFLSRLGQYFSQVRAGSVLQASAGREQLRDISCLRLSMYKSENRTCVLSGT